MRTPRVLGAVQAAPRQQGRQFRNGNAEDLLGLGCDRRAVGRSGISAASPLVRRLAISRRNTPDFVNGSRNLTELSHQMFAPLLPAAQASASVSSIRLANSGGVKYLVVGEVGNARQHIGVARKQRSCGSIHQRAVTTSFGVSPANSRIVVGG